TKEEQAPAGSTVKLLVEDRVQAAAGAAAATATLTAADPWGAVFAAFRAAGSGTTGTPDLTIAKTHAGSFAQGQDGTYTLTVSNGGTAATSAQVTAKDTLPGGLTATAMSGTGWTCTLSTLTCTRADALAGGAVYPAITLTVSVAANAPSSVTNAASVSGGGET